MTTHEKTVRLARLIGLDYHASDVKQKVWRQVKRIRFQTRRGHGWTPWQPYKCEADLEPIKTWLKRRHPDWTRTTGCDGEREHCESLCDAVLAAFDKQPEPNAPAEHNDAMRDSIGTHSDAITSELMPYGTAAKHRRQFQRLSRLRCAAERRVRRFGSSERYEACPNEWRDRVEKAETELANTQQALEAMQRHSLCIYCGEMLTDTDADRDHWRTCQEHPARIEVERLKATLARATADAETYLRIGKSRGTENEILKAELADHLHRIELAESALARITDGAEWCGIMRDGVAINVHLWHLPHCDGRKGSLLEAAQAAEGWENEQTRT